VDNVQSDVRYPRDDGQPDDQLSHPPDPGAICGSVDLGRGPSRGGFGYPCPGSQHRATAGAGNEEQEAKNDASALSAARRMQGTVPRASNLR